MSTRIITIGHHAPTWVHDACDIYQSRLPKIHQLEWVVIPSKPRQKSKPITYYLELEAQLMWQHIPKGAYIIALDPNGPQYSSEALAKKVETWRSRSQSLCLLIGGADGFHPDCFTKIHECWSLSKLTFPHAIVRLLVAEQWYRAHCILDGHPYHRA